MRSRGWRRSHKERVNIKRIKKFHNSWHRFYNANGDYIICPHWVDFIGHKSFFFLRTLTTTKGDTKYKSKYSPNSRPTRYRDIKPSGFSYGTREKDKKILIKEIKDFYECI